MTKILVVFSGSLSFCEDLGNSFFSIFCRPKSCGCVTVWESGHVRTFVCLVQDIYLFPQAGEHFSSFVYFSLLGLTRLYKVGCQLSRRELQKMQSPISPGISCHIFTRTDPDLNVIKHPFACRMILQSLKHRTAHGKESLFSLSLVERRYEMLDGKTLEKSLFKTCFKIGLEGFWELNHLRHLFQCVNGPMGFRKKF